jgi:hypothetical protein
MHSFTKFYKKQKKKIKELQEKFSELKEICNPKSYLKNLKVFSDGEKSSNSISVIMSGTIENREIVIKCSPNDLGNNSLKVEGQIYKYIILDLLKNNNTPCLIPYIYYTTCNNLECGKINQKFIKKYSNLEDKFQEQDEEDQDEPYSYIPKKSQLDFTLLNFLVLEKSNGIKLLQFISNVKYEDLICILFQIFYTCKCFDKIGLNDYDLNLNNIFIEKLNKRMILYFDLGDSILYSLETEYLVKIYDYDFASIPDKRISNNLYRFETENNIYNPYSSVIKFIRELQIILNGDNAYVIEQNLGDNSEKLLDFVEDCLQKIEKYTKFKIDYGYHTQDDENLYFDYVSENKNKKTKYNNEEYYDNYTSKMNYKYKNKFEDIFDYFLNTFETENIYKLIEDIPNDEIVFKYPEERKLVVEEYVPDLSSIEIKESENYSIDYEKINEMADKYLESMIKYSNTFKNHSKSKEYLEKLSEKLKNIFVRKYQDYGKLSEKAKEYVKYGLFWICDISFYNLNSFVIINNSKGRNLEYLIYLLKEVIGNKLPIVLEKIVLENKKKMKQMEEEVVKQEEKEEKKIIYYGEQECSAIKANKQKCNNKGYYLYQDNIRCGVHSKKDFRETLPKNPNKDRDKKDLILKRQEIVERKAKENFNNGKKGDVILTKLYMMKEPLHIDGYLKVFPNYKHQNRVDGFGCKSLSPKDIGPIHHNQPGLPVGLNLENVFQGNKVFRSEIDREGNPLPIFYETQRKMYSDPIPHRHKEVAKQIKGNKNVPLYSVWKLPNGKELHLSYYESREIYCKFYENLTKNNPDLLKLKKMLNDGYNLQIIGYDSYDVKGKNIDDCYKDTSKPFGHELVLYTLLTVKNPKDFPWNKFGKLEI